MRRIFALCLIMLSVLANWSVHAQTQLMPPVRPQVPFFVPTPPLVNVSSYILLDYHSGKVLAEKNSNERLPPASMTKIMTLYLTAAALVNEHIHLDDIVTVSSKAGSTRGSTMFLRVGQRVSVQDLIYGTSVVSGNDASIALAEHIAGSEETFVAMMNQKAQELGMTNTHFENSTGWPATEHYSSARDMAMLALATIRDFPQYYHWHAEKSFTFNDIKQNNRNQLLWLDPSVDGIKTGHTDEAGYCLSASAQRNGMRLIVVVFGAPSEKKRSEEAQKLLNYGFRFYDTRKLYSANTVLKEIKVWQAAKATVSVGIDRDLYVTFPRGQEDKLDAEMVLAKELQAPLEVGQPVGKLVVRLHGDVVAEQPLVALEAAPKGSWWKRTIDRIHLSIRNLFNLPHNNDGH